MQAAIETLTFHASNVPQGILSERVEMIQEVDFSEGL